MQQGEIISETDPIRSAFSKQDLFLCQQYNFRQLDWIEKMLTVMKLALYYFPLLNYYVNKIMAF